MKRLTAEEVASEMARLAELGEVYPGWTPHAAYEHSRDLVRTHLIPQWQDEPDWAGYYWLESELGPRAVIRGEDGRWRYQLLDLSFAALRGRVCPIGARPQ